MPAQSGTATAARRQAQEILSRPPFTGGRRSVPHPLTGVLHAIGRALQIAFGPIFRWLRRELADPVGHGFRLAFGSFAPAAGIGVAVLAGAVIAVVLVRRRTRVSAERAGERPGLVAADPTDLEREADRMAGQGDFAGAVRLRFAAGLRRLETDGLLTEADIRTGQQVAASIGSPAFERLATQHEAIAYAAASAGAGDDERAQRDWVVVPREARHRREAVEVASP